MKFKIVIAILFLCIFLSHTTIAQNYSINNGFVNGASISTCSGFFYDSNPTGDYAAGEKYSVTFCSSNPGKVIKLNFIELSIASGDSLFIYDGSSVNSNIIDIVTSFTPSYEYIISASDTNTAGCLTFRFKSDATVQASGWKAIIKCGYKCLQPIQSTITTTPSRDANGYTNICMNPNGVVDFNANTLYPNNNFLYNQSDTTSTFHWYFGDGIDTVAKGLIAVNHTYTSSAGYKAKLLVIDSNGCLNATPIEVKVRTSTQPIFKITPPRDVCSGDTIQLSPSSINGTTGAGFVDIPPGYFFQLPISGDSLFLPDGTSETYTSIIAINQFAPNQTLTNINLLKGIFINLEHSYLGDISIAITAPNGAKVFLKNEIGAPDCYLGEPVDGDLVTIGTDNPALTNIRGNGYEYVFKANPTYATMYQESGNYQYSYTDNAGQVITDHDYLPAGSYASSNSLNALLGTPLNGNWKLEIKDWQQVDNGFLFGWRLEFDQALYPAIESYTFPIISQNWVIPNTNIVSTNGTIATISSASAGAQNFMYEVVDSIGCITDTTVAINFITAPIKPQLGNDTAFCNGQTSLDVWIKNIDNTVQYLWNTGATGNSITVNAPNTFWVKATNSLGCKSRDTIVVNPPENITIQLSADTFYCASKNNILKPVVSSNIVEYVWNTGATTDTLITTAAGMYSVIGRSISGCVATDSIILTDNPINQFRLPADTTICANSSYVVNLNLPTNTSVIWNDGNTNAIRLLMPNNTYTLLANNIGCIKKDTIVISSKSLPVVSLGTDTTVCYGRTKLLSPQINGASFLWSDTSTDSLLIVTQPGLYWVEATYNGCSFRDSIRIDYKDCGCATTIPNVFSPNGDGLNDFFKPDMKCLPQNYQLSIFNRYGQPLFSTQNYLQAWDGTINGKPAPIGTYYYVINYLISQLNIPEQFAGSITILR